MKPPIAHRLHRVRQHINPRADSPARDGERPMRPASIILGMLAILFVLLLVASAISHLSGAIS